MNYDTLQQWSGYCLQQRCLELDRLMSISIKPTTLRDFYVKHKIKYRCVSYQYQQYLNRGRGPIFDFAVRLARLIEEKKTVVYFDQSSFNVWLRNRRTWSTADRPVKMPIKKDRLTGITVFGAVGALTR